MHFLLIRSTQRSSRWTKKHEISPGSVKYTVNDLWSGDGGGNEDEVEKLKISIFGESQENYRDVITSATLVRTLTTLASAMNA